MVKTANCKVSKFCVSAKYLHQTQYNLFDRIPRTWHVTLRKLIMKTVAVLGSQRAFICLLTGTRYKTHHMTIDPPLDVSRYEVQVISRDGDPASETPPMKSS